VSNFTDAQVSLFEQCDLARYNFNMSFGNRLKLRVSAALEFLKDVFLLGDEEEKEEKEIEIVDANRKSVDKSAIEGK